MTAMQVSPRINVREVNPLSDPVRSWLSKLEHRQPNYLRGINAKHWAGIELDGELLAAIGFTYNDSGAVFIDALVCAPSKKGIRSACALWGLMRKIWQGKVINFCTAPGNRKIGRAIQHHCPARPVAITWECIA